MANDLRLHLPFEISNHTPPQPTAFAEVQYRFSVMDSVPRPSARACAGASGWDALTSLGDYDGREVGLILWQDKTVVTFPPGSTFLIPTGIMPYSFTGTGESSQMIITQTLHNDLRDYVADGFQADPKLLPPNWSEGEREAHMRNRAEVLVGRYPTITEFDCAH